MANYTIPPLDGNFSVTYEEDQGGMQVIYDITNVFLDAVIKGNMFPDGFLSVENFPDLGSMSNFLELAIENIQEIIMQNICILICIILGPLLALATLVCGCCFCCCCGNKKTKSDTGGQGFKMIVLSIVLTVLLIVTSIGCLWFFLGSQKASVGLDKFPEDIEDVLHDGQLYVNHTVDELKCLLGENFDETVKQFDDALDDISTAFDGLVADIKEDTNLDGIERNILGFVNLTLDYNKIVNNLPEAKKSC